MQREKEKFPHEIGLILEYPIWDVKGFIEHKGRDFRFFRLLEGIPGAGGSQENASQFIRRSESGW